MWLQPWELKQPWVDGLIHSLYLPGSWTRSQSHSVLSTAMPRAQALPQPVSHHSRILPSTVIQATKPHPASIYSTVEWVWYVQPPRKAMGTKRDKTSSSQKGSWLSSSPFLPWQTLILLCWTTRSSNSLASRLLSSCPSAHCRQRPFSIPLYLHLGALTPYPLPHTHNIHPCLSHLPLVRIPFLFSAAWAARHHSSSSSNATSLLQFSLCAWSVLSPICPQHAMLSSIIGLTVMLVLTTRGFFVVALFFHPN